MTNFSVSATMDALCNACRDYLDHLPLYERDTRTAALVAWCLAYECPDYDSLPAYWHKAVGTLLVGLRLTRVGSGGRSRSEETTVFCTEFLLYLWGKHSRKYVALHSRGCWVTYKFDFQLCYDALWTVWRNLHHEFK